MSQDIRIEGKKLQRLLSVEIEKGTELLSDRARVQVSAMVAGQALDTEKSIFAGLPIKIALGYDGQNEAEFEGFIVSTRLQDGILHLDCEDSMYLLRKDVKNTQLKDASLVEIAQKVVSEAAPKLKVAAGKGLSDIKFAEFNILDATAWDVLQKLKTQGGITAYVRGQKLYLSLRYLQDAATEARPEVRYDFTRNVEKSSLKYMRAEERKVQVKVIGIGKDNKRYEATAGEPGQDSLSLSRYNVTDKAALKAIAEEEVKKWSYTGYEGSLTGWLLPYATYGMAAKIVDPLYPEREGTYFIERVKTTFHEQGGRREINLGLKLK